MKRFIDLRGQINDTEDYPVEFAFYNTVSDVFETFSGSQTWNSIKEFTEDYDGTDLPRYLGLLPPWVK